MGVEAALVVEGEEGEGTLVVDVEGVEEEAEEAAEEEGEVEEVESKQHRTCWVIFFFG